MRAVCCFDPLQTIPVRLLNVVLARKGGALVSGSSDAAAQRAPQRGPEPPVAQRPAQEVGCIVVDKDGGSLHAALCLASCAWARRILERVGSRGRGASGACCVSIRGLPHARTCCCGGC